MVEIAAKSVLLVEDNDVEREGLAYILRRNGYSIRTASSGGQAIEELRAEKPRLILLDMLLAGVGDDGWILLKTIQCIAEWSEIPVIIITGLDIASHDWAQSLGAKTVVHKPINTDELLLKAERYCR